MDTRTVSDGVLTGTVTVTIPAAQIERIERGEIPPFDVGQVVGGLQTALGQAGADALTAAGVIGNVTVSHASSGGVTAVRDADPVPE